MITDNDPRTTEEIRTDLEKRTYGIVQGLVEGWEASEEYGIKGLGESTQGSMSMTDATQCYWGSSGRGCQKAKGNIRLVASVGYVRVVRKGRNERVSLTDTGIQLYKKGKAQNW